MTTRGIGAGRLAWDTNLLAFPTTRRFVLGWEAIAGQRTYLLPTVLDELKSQIPKAESRQWGRVLKEQGTESEQTIRIRAAVAAQAHAWLEDEIRHNRGAFAYTAPNDEERAAVQDIGSSVPTQYLRGRAKGLDSNDRAIIGEAAWRAHSLLLTDNRGLIIADAVNRWLIQHRYTDTPRLLRTPSQYLEDLGPGPERQRRILDAACQAAIPGESRREDLSHEAALTLSKQSVRRFLESLQETAFGDFADEGLEGIENEALWTAVAEKRVETLDESSRATQTRLLDRTRAAAREEGWTR